MLVSPHHLLKLVLAAALLLNVATAEHWAVIVAGSKGYENYRHQSDACHAYHVVRRHGIPAENVILMMFDDVASHRANPFPGKLFNKPATGNGTDEVAVDVYKGCNVDYHGEDVTPEMFINVLLGNSSATKGKKVLESTEKDRVFVNFVDHGARGFIVFPEGQELTSKRLARTLKKMHETKKYKELVFYMEACESGSMFSNRFLNSINAYATTAANGLESSWGTYCPPHDTVNGKVLGTCLGDLYSVNWMEDSDLTDLSSESISEQFKRVKRETNKSHVHQFGSKRIQKEIVGNFQSNYDKGDAESSQQDANENAKEPFSSPPELPDRSSVKASSAVDVHDVELVIAFYNYLRASPGPDRRGLADDLVEQIQAREHDDALFEKIHSIYFARMEQPLLQTVHPEDFECHEQVFQSFETQCRSQAGAGNPDIGHGFTGYSLKYAGVLTDLCESGMSVMQIESILKEACTTSESKPSEKQHFNNDAVFDPELILLG
ncbi:Cysteine protease, partial [Globisporangium splendens]